MSSFTNAQVCLNGHIITLSTEQEPFNMENYCADCGAKTIIKCPSCGKQIRGNSLYDTMGFASVDVNREPDAYCPYCGKPYPWTETALKSTALLIQEEAELDEQLKKALVESLPDIISENPGTNLATARIKKALSVASSFTSDALRQFVIDFGCEFIKNQLF